MGEAVGTAGAVAVAVGSVGRATGVLVGVGGSGVFVGVGGMGVFVGVGGSGVSDGRVCGGSGVSVGAAASIRKHQRSEATGCPFAV